MINSVRDTVHDFLEKNNRGWLKPERFNNYAYLAQMEIFESYFYDYAKWLAQQNNRMAGGGFANIPRQIREKLNRFHRVDDMDYDAVEGLWGEPIDCYRLLDVFYDGDFVDEVSERRAVLLNKSNLTAPDTDYPVYVGSEFQYITVYPVSIITGVSASFIVAPLAPKWTYTNVGGNPLFNASAGDYVDFEIHPSDESRLIMKILGYAGVSIREKDVVEYAEAQEIKGKQTERRT